MHNLQKEHISIFREQFTNVVCISQSRESSNSHAYAGELLRIILSQPVVTAIFFNRLATWHGIYRSDQMQNGYRSWSAYRMARIQVITYEDIGTAKAGVYWSELMLSNGLDCSELVLNPETRVCILQTVPDLEVVQPNGLGMTCQLCIFSTTACKHAA